MPGDDKRLQEFDQLGLFEQNLLQILSIIYEPAHTTLILNCLKRLELKGPRANRPTTPLVNHYLAKLKDAGFVNDNRQCHPDIVEIIARRAVQAGTFGRFAAAVQKEAPASYYYGKWATRCWRAIRELRIGIYTQDFEIIDQALRFLESQCEELPLQLPPVVQIITRPFDPRWFGALPLSFQFFLLNHIILHGQRRLISFPEIIAFIETQLRAEDTDEEKEGRGMEGGGGGLRRRERGKGGKRNGRRWRRTATTRTRKRREEEWKEEEEGGRRRGRNEILKREYNALESRERNDGGIRTREVLRRAIKSRLLRKYKIDKGE